MSRATNVGDEPVLLKRSGTLDVWVARDRAGAAGILADRFEGLILDDGFQHLRLQRDLNICVVPDVPFEGVLPAGLWRERRSALADADLVIAVDTVPRWLPRFWNGPTARVSYVADGWQSVRGGTRPPEPWAAFCGIARPERFFGALKDAETVARLTFPDHHYYTDADWERIVSTARDAGAAALVTTAKDAVRLAGRESELPLFWRDVRPHWHHGEDMLDAGLRRIGVQTDRRSDAAGDRI